MAEDYSWAKRECLAWRGHCPFDLLEHLMANEHCVAFGPVHHFLVGASLLTCMQRVLPLPLEKALDALAERAVMVPGAACARWGVCGAAASCGMAFAVAAENAPLKTDGWSEGQTMVADILGQIAQAGAPRCCKRDSRIAVQTALSWFNEYFAANLEPSAQVPVCASMPSNAVCMGSTCVYHPQG